jgi:hypothetical protein
MHFCPGLVKDGNDSNTTLFPSLQKTMGGESSKEIADIVKKLEERGGQEQLLLFRTGSAGSGKSTAMRVAKQFCYEFCVAIGVMWSDTTFLFTAYTGSAASLIGGVTISNAAYLNLQRQLNEDDINEWKYVRILVIDEVSFMSNSILKNSTGNSHKLEIGPSCLVYFQSFLQVTSTNLNLFVQENLNFCSQVNQLNSGTKISMPSLF